MKYVFLLLLLVSANASALYLECSPKEICPFGTDLNKCVQKVTLTGHDTDHELIINYRPIDPSSEIILLPDSYSVSVASIDNGLQFWDKTGDQQGQLIHTGGGVFEGEMILDQDFPFELTCHDKTIGYEYK